MQAFSPQDMPVGPEMPVPDNLPDFNHQAEQLLKQPGADRLKIFIPAEEMKKMTSGQRLLFELKNKARVVIKDASASEEARNITEQVPAQNAGQESNEKKPGTSGEPASKESE